MGNDNDPVMTGLLEDLEFAARGGNGTAGARAAALKLRVNALSSIRKLANDKLAEDSGDVRDRKEAMVEIALLCNFSGPR